MPSKPFSNQPLEGEHQYPEKLKQSSTEENASTWDHVLKIFLNRTMPKIVESVLQSVTDLILSPVRKLVMIFGTYIR